jgi:hypothetical protein
MASLNHAKMQRDAELPERDAKVAELDQKLSNVKSEVDVIRNVLL